MDDWTVLVVGAGPVGLLIAGDLAEAGIPVLVIDQLDQPMAESRASQLTTRSAELLHTRGLHDLLSEAAHEPSGHFAGIRLDLTPLPSPYAGNWKIPQFRTEAHLRDRARSLGAKIRYGCDLVGLQDRGQGVLCIVRTRTGEQRIRADYVVGCDGANSSVRELGRFPVRQVAATKELLRADITGIQIPDRRFERNAQGFFVAATRLGVTRVMVYQRTSRPLRRDVSPSFDEVVATWRAVTGEDISQGMPQWVDRFDDAKGQALCYRRGHLLLAGDAAHWHMPIGGQALNTGLLDAANLARKLAATLQNRAGEGILDSYHLERQPAGARVIDHVTVQEMLLLEDSHLDPLRAVFEELFALRQIQEHFAATAANLDQAVTSPTFRRSTTWPSCVKWQARAPERASEMIQDLPAPGRVAVSTRGSERKVRRHAEG